MTAPASPAVATVWRVLGRDLPLGPRPLLMGIVNVTPDSFSDGGRWFDADRAVDRGLALVEAGAAVVDVGGESTRPGADPVPAAHEIERILPVVEALAERSGVPVSVDTTKLDVAREAVAAGAAIVNDVSALRFSPGLAGLAAETGAGLVLMHMRGEPRTMQADPRYDDLHREIGDALEAAALAAEAAGVARESILLDPGIGFGKTARDSWRLVAGLDRLAARGRPVLIGHSRKSFTDPAGRYPPGERIPETLAAGVLAALGGAAVLRVHDVAAHARALDALDRWREARALDAAEDGP